LTCAAYFLPMSGTIALSNAGSLPPDVEVPGKIVYFDQSGGSVGVDSFAFPGVDDIDSTPGHRPTSATFRPHPHPNPKPSASRPLPLLTFTPQATP